MNSFEVVKDKHRKFPDRKITMPLRGSNMSAGYDLYSNQNIDLEPGTSYVFWTDIKCKLNYGNVLMLFPRSSMGIKKKIMIGNTVGIIDADYYNNKDNDGNIAVCLYNYGTTSVPIANGERIAQAVIVKHDRVNSGYTLLKKEREGGIGSTGK